MKATLTLMFLAFGFQSAVVRADHEVPEGSVHELHEAAHQLEYEVRYTYLSYRVKQAVSRFTSNVVRFYTCVGGNPADDHETVGTACYGPLRSAQQTFYPVERYLYDTYYDYPRVYQEYVRVKQLLRSVGSGPAIQPGSALGPDGEPDPDHSVPRP
ncbi:MAG: hypothetical protein HYR96_09710 [Deltaproteobacteria bacterium]|nr:hypothetical protein [Deltaproteobacteria bacterium]